MKEQIISAVFKREAIWDPRHPLHKNVNVLQKLWNEIAEELGKNEKIIKSKWKYLRDYFMRERKKIPKPKSGSDGDLKKSNWQYFDMMTFLQTTLHRENTVSSLETSMKFPSNEDIINGIEERTTQQKDDESSFKSFSLRNDEYLHEKPVTKKQKKKPEYDELISLEKKKVELLQKEIENEDYDDLLFLKSLLPDIKSLPRWRKRRLRLRLQEIIIQELEESEGLSYTDVIVQP